MHYLSHISLNLRLLVPILNGMNKKFRVPEDMDKLPSILDPMDREAPKNSCVIAFYTMSLGKKQDKTAKARGKAKVDKSGATEYTLYMNIQYMVVLAIGAPEF